MIAPTDPALVALIARHEGYRAKPYLDTVGALTIGYGRNLRDVGVRHDEARLMLENDIAVAFEDAKSLVPGFAGLTPNRQRVLVDMAFNLGRSRMAKFKNMLAAIEAGDFHRAATEMRSSLWARQVGNRATELARLMEG